jgi:hypothetical protein
MQIASIQIGVSDQREFHAHRDENSTRAEKRFSRTRNGEPLIRIENCASLGEPHV